MKRNFKRISNLVLALAIMLCSFVTPCFAQEDVEQTSTVVQETELIEAEVETVQPGVEVISFEIPADAAEEGTVVVPRAVDQSFTMTTYHRGADRTYSANNLWFVVTITDANGNPVDNRVVVSLNDYNSGAISSMSVDADGTSYGHDVPIVSGRTYYFTYTKTGGTTRTLRVRMYIEAHN